MIKALVLGTATLALSAGVHRLRRSTLVTATHLTATVTAMTPATATQLRLRSTITRLRHMATERWHRARQERPLLS